MMVRIAIKPKSLAPEALMSAIRAETRMPTRWVGARAIQRRIGGTSSSISSAATLLHQTGRIERQWGGTQWEYRIK